MYIATYLCVFYIIVINTARVANIPREKVAWAEVALDVMIMGDAALVMEPEVVSGETALVVTV